MTNICFRFLFILIYLLIVVNCLHISKAHAQPVCDDSTPTIQYCSLDI